MEGRREERDVYGEDLRMGRGEEGGERRGDGTST